MYQDNKATCAVHLKNQFNNIFLRDFPNCNAYANRLKHIADQLANVGAKVADDRLVLRLVGGLTESYSTFVTVIQNMTPFTSFAKAKSMLLLDETNKKNLTSQESSNESALITSSASNNFSSSSSQNSEQHHHSGDNNNRGNSYRGHRNSNRGRDSYRGGSKCGLGGQPHFGSQNTQPQRPTSFNPPWAYPQWSS